MQLVHRQAAALGVARRFENPQRLRRDGKLRVGRVVRPRQNHLCMPLMVAASQNKRERNRDTSFVMKLREIKYPMSY